MNYYLDVLKKYAEFSGRAARQEYWMFVLINTLVAMVLFVVGIVIHTELIYILYWLGILLPSFGVGIRRLHDTNHSGWWLLIALIPIVGAIILLVFLVTDSTADNQYGPNPKGVSAPATPTAQ